MAERDRGHDFAYGFFYEDDDGTHIFQRRNPERYRELSEEHREALQPKVIQVAKLIKDGKRWEEIYDECGFMGNDGCQRPVPLRARIMRNWFFCWALPELVKELGVTNPTYPHDCKYRDECPKAWKDRKGGWGEMSICNEYRGECPRWPEDVSNL